MRNLKRSLLTIVHAWADQARVAVATFGMWSRGVIQMFREAGATTPERAQPFRARSLMEKFAFKQLLTVGAIREPAPVATIWTSALWRRLEGKACHMGGEAAA